MFTGIITYIGKVKSKIGSKLAIYAPDAIKEIKIGDSVSVNGACLTATEKDEEIFKADLLNETVKKTNLGKLRTGDFVNLELALKFGDRLGGHIVTGHVDCTGKLIRKYKKANDIIFEIEIPRQYLKNIISKGSIAINGVSLTVVNIYGNRFTIHVIPHTIKNTTLNSVKIGSLLNVEFDKYFSPTIYKHR